MTIKTINFLTILLFIGLIIGTGMMQTHLKDKPQISLLLFGSCTLCTFFIGNRFISTVLFYLLTGFMLFVAYYYLINLMLESITPRHQTGRLRFQNTMEMTWILGFVFGIVLSACTLLFYHKLDRRSRLVEMTISALFVFSTMVVLFCILIANSD